MKRRLLDILACPSCSGPLTLSVLTIQKTPVKTQVNGPACSSHCAKFDRPIYPGGVVSGGLDCTDCYAEDVLEGSLHCQCGAVFSILNGIPRMFPHQTDHTSPQKYANCGARKDRSAKSFTFQWNEYRGGERTWFKDDTTLRKREFLYSMGVEGSELSGKILLDAGCGNGELTRAVSDYGLEVIGLDFSNSVDNARERLQSWSGDSAHRVHYIQGDLLHLPIRPHVCDFVHSSGVLHHTPSTHQAFRSLIPTVKDGGKVYIQLYRRRPKWIHGINVSIRAVTRHLPFRILYGLCLLGAPLHALLSRLVHFIRRAGTPPRSTFRERALQMFDNYSPQYQHRHTVPEIVTLFRAEKFVDIRDVTLENEARHMLAVLGTKAASGLDTAAGVPSTDTLSIVRR